MQRDSEVQEIESRPPPAGSMVCEVEDDPAKVFTTVRGVDTAVAVSLQKKA